MLTLLWSRKLAANWQSVSSSGKSSKEKKKKRKFNDITMLNRRTMEGGNSGGQDGIRVLGGQVYHLSIGREVYGAGGDITLSTLRMLR